MIHQRNAGGRSIYRNLDTSFVNLAALLRYLQQRQFVGRVHIQLDEYEADVFLNAGAALRVHERNHATKRAAEGETALQRLLVRAREAGGLISVYEVNENADEVAERNSVPPPPKATAAVAPQAKEQAANPSPEESAWSELLTLSGELIAAVERAAESVGMNFAATFDAVRLEIADDYPLLDPESGRFEYEGGVVRLHARASLNVYSLSLVECLRRVVQRLATGTHEDSVREQVRREFTNLARRRQAALDRFKLTPQLDRILGIRVL